MNIRIKCHCCGQGKTWWCKNTDNCAGIGGPSRIVGKQGPMPLSDFEKIIK
jgi:hypothetical protein